MCREKAQKDLRLKQAQALEIDKEDRQFRSRIAKAPV